VLLLCSCLKSILGRSPKVKESIEDPFQVGDLAGRRSRWVTCQSAIYDRYIWVCECYYLRTSFVF
jgi:hypothetical protein